MDKIFIDTSIFESNNFLESKRIKEIYKLAKSKKIQVILPQLIVDEIYNRINKNITDAHSSFNSYRKSTRILRNIPSLFKKFEPFDKEKEQKSLIKLITKEFSESHFVIIPYSEIDISVVFQNYFNGTFPFSSGSKKSEFPDAFALKIVEKWAKENDTIVSVFSKDNDIINYKSDYLKSELNFAEYVSNKIKEVEGENHKKRLKQIDYILNHETKGITEKVKDWAQYELDDYAKYWDYSNYHEIHDLSILDIEVEIENHNITNITEDYISVQIKVRIDYQVEIEYDDEEYMIKDDDTKEWLFPYTKPQLIEEYRYVNVDLVFDVDPDNTHVYEPEIESINDGQELNI